MRVLVTGLPDKPHASAGHVLDLPDDEAKDMILRGTATAAPEEPPAELPGEPEPGPAPEIAAAPAAAPKKKSKKG